MKARPTAATMAAWVGLVRTERTLLDKVEARLKRGGLPPLAWYQVLNEVEAAPDSRLRQADVQERTRLAQYNVCRLVDRLQRDGLIERRQCRLDGRNNVLCITSKGRALRRSMWPIYAAAIEQHLGSRLTRAEAEQLAALLAKL
ncbi:MAG TPA: MarR family transcriptional regulator [Hyphomicrobiaceae bacterium]|nr:MarR family transcriptional regulator [Hyphomicrobiaceae bacterium]